MKNKFGLLFMALGFLLMIGAFSLVGYNVWDDSRARAVVESTYDDVVKQIEYQDYSDIAEELIPNYVINPNMDMPTKEVDGNDYIGCISIPVLNIDLPVMSEWSYPNLKIAPCRYTGSVYQNNLVIAAHNYASHFGGLKNLLAGDKVLFTDMDGNEFLYTVLEVEQLNADEIESMTNGDWDLTLFTCTVGGQYRVAVRCSLLEQETNYSL